ncbi:MAG: M1 family aminopeptidase [Pseudomonadota bacterium]
MLATQLEPASARRLFPGWDEPAFRATFELNVVVGSEQTAVSNMPVASEIPSGKDKKEVGFRRSVSMPTYLVALFAGELERLEDRFEGVALGIYTVKGKSGRARFAMQATREVLRWVHEYFGIPYALPKLDQVALPGGIGGAMENWGAIAYNEARLLVDPRGAPLRHRQGVYAIVAHEIAHQWFGNLVTMAWWDDLWLNEGFAQWLQTRVAERLHPEWGMRLREQHWRETAMGEDARRTAHPIQAKVASASRAMDVFDAITYAKGAAFVGMLEAYLGEERFRQGVRRYLEAHRFSNATTADLWHHLSQASGRDVAAFAAAWTGRPGFPLVRVAQRCEGGRAVLTLAQERFALNDPLAAPLWWKVPVTFADAAGARRTVLLEDAPLTVPAGRCGAILVNAGGTGYFRVQYDERTFAHLARGLGGLPPLERFRFLADAFALVQAGRLDAARYLALLEELAGETDATVWEQVIGALRFLRDLLEAPQAQAAFDRRAARILRPALERIGWDAAPGESAEAPPLWRALIEALGRAGDAEVVREARARFAARVSRPLDGAIRPAILNVVGRHADEATFASLVEEMRDATDTELRYQYTSALRHVSDPALARRWMQRLLAADELPPGEAAYNLQRIGADSGLAREAWTFVKANLPAILAKASPRGRAFLLPEAAAPFADEAAAEELLALARAKLDPGALYQAEKTAEWIRLKAAVRAREAEHIARWAQAGSG